MRANSLVAFLIFLPVIASGQTRPAADFQITKITKDLIPTPQFAYAGGIGQLVERLVRNERWPIPDSPSLPS